MLELIVNIVNKQSADESDEELVRMVGWGGAAQQRFCMTWITIGMLNPNLALLSEAP